MLFCLNKKIIVFDQIPHTRLEKADTIQVLHRDCLANIDQAPDKTFQFSICFQFQFCRIYNII